MEQKMINNLTDFHFYVGKTIMHCQTIEHDVKLILAGMKAGDMHKTLNIIEQNKMTLGEVLKNLKELDRSDDNHFFSDSDYEFLKDITKVRNHWAHKSYSEFVYLSDKNDFIKQARRLENDHDRLEKLSIMIEKVRLDALKHYDRIK